MKILIIDDEIAALETFLKHVVDDFNLDYKMFMQDPHSAINYVKENKTDAVFLDINMPKINGLELAQILVEIDKNLKIVFISGYVQTEDKIKELLGGNLLGFCYKPYNKTQLDNFFKQIEIGLIGKKVIIKTFTNFDVFINNNAIKFNSSKSKELLALLVDKCGSYLSMNEAISKLWPDKRPELAKKLYRDAVCRLRVILKENAIENIAVFARATAKINKDNVTCDLWDFYDTGKHDVFKGDYMFEYEWALDTQHYIEWQISKKLGTTKIY